MLVIIIIFILVLAVLIFVHELGHFLLAKAFGIRVDAFALGFGPKLIKKQVGETLYSINLVPFGGYVKIFGEDELLIDEPKTRGLRGLGLMEKSKWKQIVILIAGVTFNFILAWILFFILFMSGVAVPTDAFPAYSKYFTDNKVIVLDAEDQSPALAAGLKIGDVIMGIDTGSGMTPVSDIASTQTLVNSSAGKVITVGYIQDGQYKSTEITPMKGLVGEDRYAIGVALDSTASIRMPFFAAIGNGFIYTYDSIRDTVLGLWTFATSFFHGQNGLNDVAGPVGIFVIVENAIHLGLGYLLFVVAIISVSLGVINLVPFPALDGGRVFFVIVEAIIRRRIPAKFFNAVNTVGFALLIILMIAVTWKDIANLIG